MSIFTVVQDLQDSLIDRFCHEGRLLKAQTPWFDESEPFEVIQECCLERILFFEARGYYLFREPEIDHQPGLQRLRIEMTFKPTESNK